ncbi:MAG: alpha/beta hydrolase, partial [Polyangiaceae bacterium]|nr:alpha/beta hydrolase [Polyangiaceae bacterium]
PFSSVTDSAAPGPFARLEESSPAKCKIYRPAVLGEKGRRHPVIIWGNGTTAWPAIYGASLTHWASHGFIVAAANTSNAGTGQEMLACLDWVFAENDRAGSPYEDHVDLDGAGASGHSQGGGGTIMAGRDPRVTVTAPVQPYVLLFGHEPESQSEQNGPMLLLSGGKDAIATIEANQIDVFEAANVPVFWGTLNDADHFAALGDMDGYLGPVTAWFRLHLMNDENATKLFYGPACDLCVDPEWTVERKAMQ